MEAFIIGNSVKEISSTDLTVFPQFLCLNNVQLFYDEGQKTIEEKCHSIENYLRLYTTALKETTLICFYGVINRNYRSSFNDHSILLSYLNERLLPICNSSHCYKIVVDFYSNKKAETNFISSMLHTTRINQCSYFEFWGRALKQPSHLPVDAISNWLNRKIGDGREVIIRAPKEIFLKINMARIQNAMELCDHLASVSIICL